MTILPRRAALSTLGAALAAPLVAAAFARTARAAAPLRIGFQKNGSLVILRRQGTLDALLAPAGMAVQWVEFPAGPPILEALNAGSIDFAATGETPPIFAQAAGTDLVYVGAQPMGGEAQAIVVRDAGPVRTLADLKGRRVGFARGTSAHNLVVQALAKAGLAPADIQAVPLQPADGAAAFRAGSLDAWAIWDPLLAIAETDPATRVLARNRDIAPSNSFFLARRAWADSQPVPLRTVLDAVNGAAAWARANPDRLAELMASVTGVPLDAQRLAAPRGVYAVQPMDDTVIAQQQATADTFARLRIIPARVDVRRAVWRDKPGAA